ncbi:MAG: NYN domain-containing protein [Patescibacteria group bacterium]|nr:NYN domain-containing protein [Patescibacteria group bacterium]
MKVIFFIDGFNLYHAIDNNFNHGKYKWLDLRKLSNLFIEENEQIKKIFYFSTFCPWNKEKMIRHKKYVRALSKNGVEMIRGSFQLTTKRFIKGKMNVLNLIPPDIEVPAEIKFQSYEEKKTDVNIAVKIIECATLDIYDHFYILSGDSDFVPAIKYVRKNYQHIKLTNILPINSAGQEIGKACHAQLRIEEDHLRKSLLEQKIVVAKDAVIEKPEEYS